MALACTVSPKSMPFARMSASANSLVVCGPVASAAAQIAQGSPCLNRRWEAGNILRSVGLAPAELNNHMRPSREFFDVDQWSLRRI